jgi:hypothetical protein
MRRTSLLLSMLRNCNSQNIFFSWCWYIVLHRLRSPCWCQTTSQWVPSSIMVHRTFCTIASWTHIVHLLKESVIVVYRTFTLMSSRTHVLHLLYNMSLVNFDAFFSTSRPFAKFKPMVLFMILDL